MLGKARGGPAAFLAALASGHPERFEGYTTWATPTFEVTSGAPIDIGLDGETKVMESPLRFSIRPSPVRVRLPKHAIGYSPAARSLGWQEVGAPTLAGRPRPPHPVRQLSRAIPTAPWGTATTRHRNLGRKAISPGRGR